MCVCEGGVLALDRVMCPRLDRDLGSDLQFAPDPSGVPATNPATQMGQVGGHGDRFQKKITHGLLSLTSAPSIEYTGNPLLDSLKPK